MQTQHWNEIQAGSKIILDKNMLLKGFNGELRPVKAGTYYIIGFWVDMCGLSRRLRDTTSQLYIQSRELTAFNNVI